MERGAGAASPLQACLGRSIMPCPERGSSRAGPRRRVLRPRKPRNRQIRPNHCGGEPCVHTLNSADPVVDAIVRTAMHLVKERAAGRKATGATLGGRVRGGRAGTHSGRPRPRLAGHDDSVRHRVAVSACAGGHEHLRDSPGAHGTRGSGAAGERYYAEWAGRDPGGPVRQGQAELWRMVPTECTREPGGVASALCNSRRCCAGSGVWPTRSHRGGARQPRSPSG